MKPSTTENINLRGRRIRVRLWGSETAPRLVLLHGWMDVAASFQFVVDAFAGEWRVVAPDWRGFGGSEWNGDCYWFPDYLADLDALLHHYSPDAPLRLAGHSMGGNVAALYAGTRPERVARLALLEGFGLAAADPAEAPARYRKWLDQTSEPPVLRDYADSIELAARLIKDNPRLAADRALFLAEALGVARPDGRIAYAADPYHRIINPVLYRLEETRACWRQIAAPVLWVVAEDSFVARHFRDCPEDYQERLGCFGDVREVRLADAGHNMHHDQPQRLAAALEEFFAS